MLEDRIEKYKEGNEFHQKMQIGMGGVAPGGKHKSWGYIKGYLKAKDLQKQQNQDARAQGAMYLAEEEGIRQEKMLDMKQEKFSWEREDRAKGIKLQEGMASAMQAGGYSGVIDFLKANNPKMAMQFEDARMDLDAKMMKSDVMKAAMPNEYAKILAEGYGIIGQMGSQLLKAPEKDRAGMYKALQPILSKINPDAPKTLNKEAINMLQLGAAQSMPANIAYQNQQQMITAKSRLGKLDVDIRSRIANGETVEDSPSLRAMVDKYQKETTNAEIAKMRLDDIEFKNQLQDAQRARNTAQMQQAKYNLTSSMNSKLQSESKAYLAFRDQKATFDGAIKAISSGGGGAAEVAAYRQVAMMFNKGALSDPDVAAFANSDDMIRSARKKLESIDNGEGIKALNPSEVQRLKVLMNSVSEKIQAKQDAINKRYKGMASKFGVDAKDLSIYETLNDADGNQFEGVPDYSKADIEYTAKLKGISPQEVVNMLKQKNSGAK